MKQKLKRFFKVLWQSFVEAQEARAKAMVANRNKTYL